MSSMTEMTDDEILELAVRRGHKPRAGTWGRTGSPGQRYVRTPEGAEKYGLPMGALITRDAMARAKVRGRTYAVPEDDKTFGSQAPAVGRTRRNAGEIVRAIRSSPPPRVVTPEGPKKIAIGERGYSFPEGSRAFRSNKHDNFAIVRTPDYQLVGITSNGVAFELDGDLEKELNEELDDDVSEFWTPDEPNANVLEDVDGDGETGQADGAEEPQPARVEDAPGYLNEDMIQGILSGMESSGMDQSTRDMAELQLRRNNDRIRTEYEANAEPTEDVADPDGEESSAPTMETVSQPTPDRQPQEPKTPPVPAKPAAKAAKVREDRARSTSTTSRADGKVGQHHSNIEARRKASTETQAPTEDEQLSALEELARTRPTGVAEGKVKNTSVAVRRNRVNDALEYSTDNETLDRDSVLERSRVPEKTEPRDTSGLEPDALTDEEVTDVLDDLDEALRRGLITRREVRQRRAALQAEKVRRALDDDDPNMDDDDLDSDVAGPVGDVASPEWAEGAEAGSAVQTNDVVAVRNEDGSWETPIGTLNKDHFEPSDVENDDAVILRNGPGDRPVGATTQLTSAEDLDMVQTGDGLAIRLSGHDFVATRRKDGTFDIDMGDGLVIQGADAGNMFDGSAEIWHVPNQDLAGAPSKPRWSIGDKLRSLDDFLAQKIGTRLHLRQKGGGDKDVIPYVVDDGGAIRPSDNIRFPASAFKGAMSTGRLRIQDIPARDTDEGDAPQPRRVTNADDYVNGDLISDYRHLRDMAPGQQVTMVVPAHRNGGQEAQVVLTRTRDEADLGGFMFLVGSSGRGYNSFGENNASIFQAIHEGRLHFGDTRNADGVEKAEKIANAGWSRDRNISLWEGGPDVSEYDLRTFIASQVASRAMQGSYYNTDLLPGDSPFRSQALRKAFSEKAIEQYSVTGNPARHKPAMIRLAAEKLGLTYTDPGSTLIPDDLTMDDFNTNVTIGRWLRRDGSPENPAERNMGPERIDVTRADIKTALAVIDNMLVSDDQGDPDKILKRVFARQGSPLQDLNVAASIAAYFQVRRYRVNPDGSKTLMTTIGRQYDKRRNRALLRQMLLEQLEGREPGYYGTPEDEAYQRPDGKRFVNVVGIGRPSVTTRTDTNPNAQPDPTPEPVDSGSVNDGVVEPEAPGPFDMTPERRDYLDDYATVQAAYVDANRTGDAMNYINSVLGDAGLAEMNDGTITMRQQFTRAWNQSNGVAEQIDAPATPAVGDVVYPGNLSDLPDGSVIDYVRLDGRISRYTRRDGQWYTQAGNEIHPERWDDVRRFNVVGNGSGDAPAESAPEAPPAPPVRELTFDEVEALPVGVRVINTNPRTGQTVWITALNGSGDPILLMADGSAGGRHRTASFLIDGETFRAEIATSETTMGDPRFAPGGSFTGSEIREVPVGSHIRGASGVEYEVTENGIRPLNGGHEFAFPVVARNNANFTFEGAQAPETPTSAVGQTSPDNRIGSTFDVTELMSLPRGDFVRSSGGTVWQLNGSYMTSTSSGTRRRLRNLRPGTRYRYLGNTTTGAPVSNGRPTPSGPVPSLEAAGLSRVPQTDIERYDRPRPMPNVGFDQSNTEFWDTYMSTEAGQADLRSALLAALPAGSSLSLNAHSGGFSASYSTPDGAGGSMTRERRGATRIENAVARAGGANFSGVQDHLFAFYRQHGITEVEVHGLSGGSWNGAHTWIRRGFRPDPDAFGSNLSVLGGLRDDLQRIIRRTEGGEYPHYQEFLEESKDLASRMTDLLNDRNSSLDERNERLYQLWRELTYLGEVRNAAGQTQRGLRQSIGWRLLGTSSSSRWYYGVRDIEDYFEN